MPDVTPAPAPSRARLIVLIFLCSMAFILYLDRICMNQAAKPIMERFEIKKTRMSAIMIAFTVAYGLFEIPTGRWGDRYGSRNVLTRIVVWWSAFTALTAACWGFWSMLVVRFLFGAGEAGAYPNAARIIARWFPAKERGRVQGLIQTVSLIGGVSSPVLAAYIIEHFGWRAAFVIFGAVGVVWAGFFHWWFRDDPAKHPAVNAEELAKIQEGGSTVVQHDAPIPWAAVFRCPTIWLLGLIISCSSFNSYLYFSWYSTYLQEGRHVKQVEAGWLCGLVLGAGALGTTSSGIVADWLKRRASDLRAARRNFVVTAYLCAAGAVIVSRYCDSSRWSAAFAGLSIFFMMNQQAIWWNAATEISGKHLGSLFGLMNGLGVIGAIGSQFFFPWFADLREAQGFEGRDRFDPAFWIFAGLLVFAAFCWLFVDPSRPVDAEQKRESQAT